MKNIFGTILFLISVFLPGKSICQQTEVSDLSGTDKDHMVDWQFFCTAGRNSGKWTKIGVPSCWELQGFGKYDYGFAKDKIRGKEEGLYQYQFDVPVSWKGKQVNIVFEGVMTDAAVKINGRAAGTIHQGAFYEFRYNITGLLKYGSKNLLEVTVSKHSANQSVNDAERKADFWLFGGIFRPVWLEALPVSHIEHLSVDAKANGDFSSEVTIKGNADKLVVQLFTSTGKQFGKPFIAPVLGKDQKISISHHFEKPLLWNAESPALYKAVFSLYKNGKLIHTKNQKFGFRTIEVRPRDGLYVNGVKIKFKGINRHSFWPTSGRTTSKALSIEDVTLMKDMNMNAVRMSHYPPDTHFLDVCDSLGLYVMDELAGWHGHYDTPTGSKLVKEMIDRDLNHPSVIFWSNGNEGGHNLDLDSLFSAFDVQKRPVIHPWADFGGFDTQHYREYNYGIGNYELGHSIIMPTEFLHGLYDGGHGAGLEDYWESMWHNPLAAGGFLWDFADEGVVRKDKGDSVDTDGNHGADGIIGPFHEKEGSYFTVKEVWSPVHFEKKEITSGFDGIFTIENRYNFTNLSACTCSWQLKQFGFNYSNELNGTAMMPSVLPGEKGKLKIVLPTSWKKYDVLYVTIKDPLQKELFTWSFPITLPAEISKRMVLTDGDNEVKLVQTDSTYMVTVKDIKISFDRFSGVLQSVQNAKGKLPFTNGPVIEDGVNNFSNFSWHYHNKEIVIESAFDKKLSYNTLQWTIYPSGWIKMQVRYFPSAYFTNMVGVNFLLPENEIVSVKYMGNGPYRVWKNRLKGTRFGVWDKPYNNTETGESWNYPEFKGYYSNFYGGFIQTRNQRFTVVTETEDLFLRLYTPAWKTDQWHNYELIFPKGDISFMQGISSIGTKTQRNETTGPMGIKNIFYDYEKDPSRALEMKVYFDFSGK